jgi:putative cell wall-binding protein
MTLHFQKKKESIGKLKTSQRDQKQEKKRKSPSRLKGDNSKIQKQKQEENKEKKKRKKSKREPLKSENYDFQALVKALQSLFIFEFKVIFMCLFFMQQTFMEIQI